MAATETDRVLKRFVSEIKLAVPTIAVWAHGSLALGDLANTAQTLGSDRSWSSR